MKKALVLAFVLVLGLGAWAFAGPLTGSVDFSASFVPSASDFNDFVDSLSATIELDYTIGGWTFGSSSGFNLHGFSSQQFTAEGTLGAFTLSSTMNFKPATVTKETWAYNTTTVNSHLVDTQTVGFVVGGDTYCHETTPQSASGDIWNVCWWKNEDYATVTKTTGAVFDDWKVVASVSIAGVDLEGIFFLEGYSGAADATPYAWYWSGSGGSISAIPNPNKGGDIYAEKVQSGAYDIWTTSDPYLHGFKSTPTTTGSGYRFKAAGTAGDVTITSYTYFNLTESDATAACGACGYSFARSGTFKIASAGCDVGFTEEYLTLEGFSFGCATMDVALDITCTGFQWVKFLFNDVDLGVAGITLDGLLTFETTSKTFTLTPCLTLNGTCFTFETGLSWSGNEIGGLSIYGISFSQEWNGITFSSKTAFDTDNSCLFGKTGKSVTDSSKKIQVLVPVTGLYTSTTESCSSGSCASTDTHRPSILNTGAGYYTPWCIYTEKYVVWEEFSLEATGDSCCGGSYDISFSTYFGDKQLLNGWVWEYQFYSTSPTYDVDYTEVYDIPLDGVEDTKITKFATADAPDDISADGLSSGEKYEEDLTKKAYYYDASDDTLFAWVQTDVDASLEIGSAWTLTAGLSIDVYGWNSLSFGVGFEF